jgi:hypothetical protein
MARACNVTPVAVEAVAAAEVLASVPESERRAGLRGVGVDGRRQVGKRRWNVGSDQNGVNRTLGVDGGSEGINRCTDGNRLARCWHRRRHGESSSCLKSCGPSRQISTSE